MRPHVWKVHDEVVSVGLFRGSFDLLLRHVQPAVSDVLGDGGGEKNGLLADHSDHLPQVADVEGADVVTVDKYLHTRVNHLINI